MDTRRTTTAPTTVGVTATGKRGETLQTHCVTALPRRCECGYKLATLIATRHQPRRFARLDEDPHEEGPSSQSPPPCLASAAGSAPPSGPHDRPSTHPNRYDNRDNRGHDRDCDGIRDRNDRHDRRSANDRDCDGIVNRFDRHDGRRMHNARRSYAGPRYMAPRGYRYARWNAGSRLPVGYYGNNYYLTTGRTPGAAATRLSLETALVTRLPGSTRNGLIAEVIYSLSARLTAASATRKARRKPAFPHVQYAPRERRLAIDAFCRHEPACRTCQRKGNRSPDDAHARSYRRRFGGAVPSSSIRKDR